MDPKTKKFDAVAESRIWRETTSRKLDAMSMEERLAHLEKLRLQYGAAYRARQAAEAR